MVILERYQAWKNYIANIEYKKERKLTLAPMNLLLCYNTPFNPHILYGGITIFTVQVTSEIHRRWKTCSISQH